MNSNKNNSTDDTPIPWYQSILNKLSDFWKALRNTPQAFKLVWQASPTAAIAGTVLTVITGLLPAAQAWAGKLIIDTIMDAISSQIDPVEGIKLVLPYLGLEFALVLIRSLSTQLKSLFDRILQSQLTNLVNSLIIEKAIVLDLQFFEDSEFYDMLQNARRQADVSTLRIINSTLQMVQQIITLISLIFVLIQFNPWLVLIIFLTAIPTFLSQSQYAALSFRAVSHRAPESRLLNYLEMILTGNDTVKEIKLFGLGKPLLERFKILFNQFFEEDKAIAKKKTFAGIGWGLLSNIAYYASYGWIVFRTIAGMITLGDMTMYLANFRQAQTSLSSLLDSLNSLYESNLFLDNLLDYLAIQPKLVSPVNGKIAPAPIKQGIEFRHVSFKYPGADTYVLQDINFFIRPAERIALVGLNGAGKTTLIKLLTRLYDPTEGQILMDGVDLREFDLTSLNQRFGVIFQDFVRYQFSVKENIGFGQIDQLDNMERIQDSANRGGAAPIIEKMPLGYDTVLGRRWESGIELSGGEWQKIALSRAFMRDAEVLVLDEPTSALDAEAEFEVFKRFGELMEDRIAVLISHRFSTVRMVDRILVLSAGKVIESGSHEELMNLKGVYAGLFNLQAEGYR